eukprot:1736181-Rhodomonas_salina.1
MKRIFIMCTSKRPRETDPAFNSLRVGIYYYPGARVPSIIRPKLEIQHSKRINTIIKPASENFSTAFLESSTPGYPGTRLPLGPGTRGTWVPDSSSPCTYPGTGRVSPSLTFEHAHPSSFNTRVTTSTTDASQCVVAHTSKNIPGPPCGSPDRAGDDIVTVRGPGTSSCTSTLQALASPGPSRWAEPRDSEQL